MLKAVFFDAAGTLFDPRRPVGESYASIARQYGAKVSVAEVSAGFRRAFGAAPGLAFGPARTPAELRDLEREWWRQRVAETFSGLDGFDDFEAYFDELFAFFADSANWLAFDDTVPLLKALREEGLQLGVISNFDSRLYQLLQGLELAQFFDSVTISSEAGYAKPAPELFAAALAKHGIEPHEALHIGDSPHLDVPGAAKAGIMPVLVQRTSGARKTGAGSTLVISSFQELPAIIHERMIGWPP